MNPNGVFSEDVLPELINVLSGIVPSHDCNSQPSAGIMRCQPALEIHIEPIYALVVEVDVLLKSDYLLDGSIIRPLLTGRKAILIIHVLHSKSPLFWFVPYHFHSKRHFQSVNRRKIIRGQCLWQKVLLKVLGKVL